MEAHYIPQCGHFFVVLLLKVRQNEIILLIELLWKTFCINNVLKYHFEIRSYSFWIFLTHVNRYTLKFNNHI